MPKAKKWKEYEYNPFRINGAVIRRRGDIKAISVPKMDSDTGVMNADIYIENASMDIEPHVRVFTAFYDLMAAVSSPAISVLAYIMKNITYNDDKVRLNVIDIMKDMRIKSRSSVYAGIDELIRFQVIVNKNEQDMYFINPYLLFKGTRVKWFKETSAAQQGKGWEKLFPKDILTNIKKALDENLGTNLPE
jgi:hypothetical protein